MALHRWRRNAWDSAVFDAICYAGSALNDSKETEYTTDLFQQPTRDAIAEKADDPEAVTFLSAILGFTKQEPDTPTLGISKFFVSCFSSEPDDLNQWSRSAKGPGRYALGLGARGLDREPNSTLYRVMYDREKQKGVARKLVEATLGFYREGLTEERRKDPDLWAQEFYLAWDEWIYKLAPVAKDPKWKSETEYRIVHELKASDVPFVRFSQKKTMLSRYLTLDFPCWVKRRTPFRADCFCHSGASSQVDCELSPIIWQ